jgi:hypothetical protein
MPRLRKLWVARLYEKNSKHSFAAPILVADSFDEAEDLASRWAKQKFNGRVRTIKVERSRKGEIVADD